MYHITREGKIYPCRAKKLKCQYHADMHGRTKEELYYKVIKIYKEAEPAQGAQNELYITGRIKSLYSASPTIASVNYPLEVIIATLESAIEFIKGDGPKRVEQKWENFKNTRAEDIYRALSYGMGIPDFVPDEIMREGDKLFRERMRGLPTEYAQITRNTTGLRTINPIIARREEYENYLEYKNWGLTEENKENTLGWLEEDFLQFSHDLNTSKMITQPVFYVNLEKIKEIIKNMSDLDLLASYDDYLLTNRDIEENVKLANYFEYDYRDDLTMEANSNIKKWYNRNKEIYQDLEINNPKRIVLSVKMSDELDRRGINRQDNPVGRR